MYPEPTAASEYERHIASISRSLAELTAHFTQLPTPPRVQWTQVGDLQHCDKQLRELTDRVFKRGEYHR